MTLTDALLDEELADTLADARRRRGRAASERAGTLAAESPAGPPAAARRRSSRSDAARLARDLVGPPTPPKLGVCCYCGGPAPRRTTCTAHSDLPRIDPTTGVETTTATTGRNHAA